MPHDDALTILTLDAGGTNFVFSAIQNGLEIVLPLSKPAFPNDLDRCMSSIKDGFQEIIQSISQPPDAISFAFPGPADYERGIIGDLPNFPAFRGGVALGPYLQEAFNIPVFINNDGNLFAYGEALAGALPKVNKLLEEAGNPTRFKNLIAFTLGTGFGCGVVLDGHLLKGDNGCGGNVWLSENRFDHDLIAEENVSIRGILFSYKELSGDDRAYTPFDIYQIAEGIKMGDRDSAIQSFVTLGKSVGFTIAEALNIIDGIVVIGGGISNAYTYILPSLLEEVRGFRFTRKGDKIPKLQFDLYNLDDTPEREDFLRNEWKEIAIPGTTARKIAYKEKYKTAIMKSTLDTSKAISLGAYYYAIEQLKRITR